jgi:hypothetical protein
MTRLRADLIRGMLATIQFSLLSSWLLSRNVKVKIYKTIILIVVLYKCETWSLMLWEEHRLRVFENRVLRRILRLRQNGGSCTMRNFIICTHPQMSLSRSIQDE